MNKIYGIDVSKHNGKIDWNKVKASGKEFAFIRVGWAGYDGRIAANGGLDPMYHTNMQGAIRAGLNVGVYVYSYANSPASARNAAQEVLTLIEPYNLTYPIAFDVEETKDKCLLNQGSALSITVKAFLDTIKSAGHTPMVYTYTSFALSYLNMQLLEGYDTWIADYREQTGTNCPYTGEHTIWQYRGDTGRCDGVIGACDLNIAYKDYADKHEPQEDYKQLYFDLKAKYDEVMGNIQALADKYRKC